MRGTDGRRFDAQPVPPKRSSDSIGPLMQTRTLPSGSLEIDLRVVTYNIHRSRGLDGRILPLRIAAVLERIGADIVALQEVIGPGPGGGGHAEQIGAALGMGWVMASTRRFRSHLFGNVVMSRLPVRHHVQHDLTWKTCEPRCCQRVDVMVEGRRVRLYNVHLGTALLRTPASGHPPGVIRARSQNTGAEDRPSPDYSGRVRYR